ncbi:extracellular solute-binding protein [Paenibacillus wynnii]|uniref:ABC transporter substrate-binding protein n=1 Tax=Paenibacillus wynnii TaxID=268407 RepID=A0A098MFF6_9BACL|nr:extracellular solute-binding protein [Paenibacillus wynnii]KGE20773.1 ABC transporter substrate-binding protein [Paenibacillus wynnii]
MKTSKVSQLLLAGMLASSLLAACSGNDNNSPNSTKEAANTNANVQSEATAAPGDSTVDAVGVAAKVKPVHFTTFVNYDWYTAPTWEERPHGQWITENLKVTLTPVQSNGAAAQKLNSMIVSNELPDVIVMDRGKDVERLQKAGKLVALDPYLDKYPEFIEAVGEETLNMLRSGDGKLYQIPNWYINGDNGNGNAGYLIEKKIYKTLGSPALETWDDLEAYLKLVKEKFPDIVPIDFGETRDGADVQMMGMLYSGAGDDRTPGFISPGSGQIFGVPNGSELTSVYKDPAFKEAALYSSRLFREGLTSQDLLTQTRDQVLEKLKTGKIAVFGAYDSVVEGIGREANNQMKAKDPEDGYEVIWPVHKDGVDKNKVYPSGFNTLGWNVNVITTNAKDPEAIFSYMNWATSPEGQQVIFFGPQGLFYDTVENGVPIPNDAYINRDLKKYDELKIGEFNWNGNTSYVDATKAQREKLLPAEAQDWTTLGQANITFKTSKNVTEFSNLDPTPNSEEGIILQRLKDQYAQVVPKIIFAKSDEEVNRLIEEADKEAVKMGYDKVLKWKTDVWQNNLKKIKG